MAYLLVGALLAVLAGVTSLVLTGNTLAEREAEVAHLEQEEEAARARAESLSAFANFAAMQQARALTVSSLAQSRFDWERVLRELALVLPEDVWLTGLNGKVSSGVSVDAEGDSGLAEGITGPSLGMVGCAAGHESAARLVAALEDIDGVTRVGLATSQQSDLDAAGSEATEGCTARNFLSTFEIVVAFDGVEVEAAVPSQETAPGTAQITTSSEGG